MEVTAVPDVSGGLLDWSLAVAKMLENPLLILLFLVLCFLMLIIFMEKREKSQLLNSTLEDHTEAISVMADEMKTYSEAMTQVSTLLQLMLLKDSGENIHGGSRKRTENTELENKDKKRQSKNTVT